MSTSLPRINRKAMQEQLSTALLEAVSNKTAPVQAVAIALVQGLRALSDQVDELAAQVERQQQEAIEHMHARIAESTAEALRAVEKRCSEMRYCGVWTHGKAYERGNFVTFGGSLWHANTSTQSKPPCSDWTLAVQRGKDAT